jgi:hypothetical protein
MALRRHEYLIHRWNENFMYKCNRKKNFASNLFSWRQKGFFCNKNRLFCLRENLLCFREHKLLTKFGLFSRPPYLTKKEYCWPGRTISFLVKFRSKLSEKVAYLAPNSEFKGHSVFFLLTLDTSNSNQKILHIQHPKHIQQAAHPKTSAFQEKMLKLFLNCFNWINVTCSKIRFF